MAIQFSARTIEYLNSFARVLEIRGEEAISMICNLVLDSEFTKFLVDDFHPKILDHLYEPLENDLNPAEVQASFYEACKMFADSFNDKN